MSVDNLHELSLVQIHTDAVTPAEKIGGLTQLDVDLGTDVTGGPRAGQLYSAHESVRGQRPDITFTTEGGVKTALDNAGVLGLRVEDGANSGLIVQMRKRQPGGQFVSTNTNRTYQVTDGLLFPVGMRCDFQGDLQASYRCVPIYDGANDIIQLNENQALIASPAENERYTLYSVALGGQTFDQARSVDIDFGQDVVIDEGAVGDVNKNIWPTHVSIRGIYPTVTIAGIDIGWWHDVTGVPIGGMSTVHATGAIYFIQRAHGSTFTAVGSAAHVKLTFDGLTVVQSGVSAGDKESGTCTLSFTGYQGTDVPITIATASAIT